MELGKNIKIKVYRKNLNNMELEEFKSWVRNHDKHIGIYKSTLAYKEHRAERLDSFPFKALSVAQWLIGHGIDFNVLEALCTKNRKPIALLTDIYIPEYKIAIRYVDEEKYSSRYKAQCFYNFMKYKSFPLFIRSTESDEFILEKLQNCMKDLHKYKKMGLVGNLYELVPQKRARFHKVIVEKVERRRHEQL